MIGILVGFGGELDVQDVDGNTPLVRMMLIDLINCMIR